MLLSARILNGVSNVNSFSYAASAEWNQGDATFLYVQLVDASQDRPEQGFNPAGRRYVPANGATLNVTFVNIDDAKAVTRTASQPFAGDPSIWMVPVLATDKIRGTVSLKLSLVEGSVTTKGTIQGACRVHNQDAI